MRLITLALCLTALSACRSGGGDGGSSATYIVGGTVVGLSGEVVVQNNGADALTIGANGSFNFPTQLASGASYAVSIKSDPSAQKCSVSNGQGVARGNVTNVQVSCATLMSVTNSTPLDAARGLPRSLHPDLYFSVDLDPGTATAANVTLNDGSANVSAAISVAGSVVTVRPNAPLKPFTDYTLGVSTGIRGQTGEVIGAPFALHFSTSDIAWTEPAQFPYAPASPEIAMDAAGNVLAVWVQAAGVTASQYVVGSGWSPSVLISGPGSFTFPRIEIDDAGNAIAVWRQLASNRHVLWANRYVAGVGWNTAAPISDPSMSADINSVNVAFDATGNAVAVWEQYADANSSTPSTVVANFYTLGTGWGTPTSIQVDTSLNGKYSTVAVDSNGNAIIIWTAVVSCCNGHDDRARDSRYIVSTGLRLSETVLPKGSYTFGPGEIGIDAAGNVVFVWTGRGTVLGYRYLVESHYSAATGWTVGTATTESGSAQIVFNSAGDAFALWGGDILSSVRYAAGTGWGTPVILWDSAGLGAGPSGDGYDVFGAQIAIDSPGNGIALWYDQPHGHGIVGGSGPTYVSSSRYAVGQGWGARSEIGLGSQPKLAANAAGKAFVMWSGGFYIQTL